MNPVLELMQRHRSVRAYRAEPLPEPDLQAAVGAAQMASTSSHTQSYCVIRVTDGSARLRLAELCGDQRMVAEAAAFLVVCGDCRRHKLLCDRSSSPHIANIESFLVAVIDASLFAQNLALAFESQGLGICYVGGLRNRLDAVDALLELPAHVMPLFGLCVGWPADLPATKPRLPIEAVLFSDRYPADAEMLGVLDAYDAAMTRYYAGRGIEGRSWSDGIRRMRQTARRAYLAAYYRRKGADLGAGEATT